MLGRTGYVPSLCSNDIVWISISIACISMGYCVTSVQVGPRDIEYMKKYKSNEKELQYAVEEHLYPPAISLEVVQSKVPRHLQSPKRILLHVHGAKEGVMKFPIDVIEEKEGVSCVLVLCTSVGISLGTH